MMIRFTCPHCEEPLVFPITTAGQARACHRCQSIVMVPDPQRSPTGFVSTEQLVFVLTVLFVGHAVFDGSTGLLEALRLASEQVATAGVLWSDGETSFTLVDLASLFLGLGSLVLYLGTIPVFCIWLYRSNRNARALGAQGLKFTPGWSVGWFFIPIANLFLPYQAVRELFQASDPEADATGWQHHSIPAIVGGWWALWIISNLLGQLEFRLALREGSTTEHASSVLAVINGVLGIALALAALTVVRQLHQRQEAQRRRGGAGVKVSPA